MKRLSAALLLFAMAYPQLTPKASDLAGNDMTQNLSPPCSEGTMIDSAGDIRAIMGIGKSICVSGGGEAIAVFYGARTGDPDNSMRAQVAYSLDHGASWTIYGPFGNPPCRRLYHSIDGTPNFHINPGELYFVWQENTLGYNDGVVNMMIEENVPSAPSFSVPGQLPNSSPPFMYPWEPDIAVAQDNPANLVVTAWSFLANGNEWGYCWVSNDGGYTWSGPFPMGFISQDGSCGCVSQGTDGYVFYTYHAYFNLTPTDSIPYPYYMESTDGGYTWSEGTPIPVVPASPGSQFWWHEFDCLVINNEPWVIHNDIGNPGGGPYIMHGIGSPGNWTWEIWDAGQLGTCSLSVADTTFYCYPSQYPSISHDPVSNTILASYKAYFYKEYNGTVYYNGAHIGGLYTTNNGANWTISQPLSDTNTTQIAWGDWSYTELAHRLVNIDNDVYSYALWVHVTHLILYFERGLVKSFLPLAIEENDVSDIHFNNLHINPSVSRGKSIIQFSLSHPANINIKLYDTNGRLVKILHKGHLSSGYHTFDLQTGNLPNGVYFVSLECDCVNTVSKLVLVK